MTKRRNFIKQLGGSALLLGAGSLKNLAAQEQQERIILAQEKSIRRMILFASPVLVWESWVTAM